MTDLKISIILPVYNGEKYLSQSIESCLNQTFKNIELIKQCIFVLFIKFILYFETETYSFNPMLILLISISNTLYNGTESTNHELGVV